MSVPSPPASSSQRFFAALHAAPVRRVRHGKVIAGTAAGVARYFGIDPIVVRVAFVLFTVTGIGVTSYLIAWFLLPDDDDTVLVERAVRDHHGGAITLGVFAALSIFSGDHGGWKQSLTTALVIGAIGFYLWRRHTQRGGTSRGGADATSGVPTAPPPPAQRPGAPEHGSPTRGGFSRFDPVTGRWVPATSGPAPAAAVPHRQSEPVASGEPVDRLDTPIHPFGPGRAATWAAPDPLLFRPTRGRPKQEACRAHVHRGDDWPGGPISSSSSSPQESARAPPSPHRDWGLPSRASSATPVPSSSSLSGFCSPASPGDPRDHSSSRR